MSSYHLNNIHPTALVSEGASIGTGTIIGAYSVIGPNVVIGERNCINSHVVIEGHTWIGNDNHIFQFASVGSAPQDLKFKGEPSELRIGHNNIIREYATLQPGTTGGGMLTSVGDRNLFMVNSHVGHDTVIGDRCVFANSAALSGHVTIGNGVIVGGLSGIHQFVRVGDIAMIGAGAMVSQDIPCFCMAQGDRAKLIGLNRVGLERNGASKEDIALLKRLYRLALMTDSAEVQGKTFRQRIDHCRTLVGQSSLVMSFIDFLAGSPRGVARHRTSSRMEGETSD